MRQKKSTNLCMAAENFQSQRLIFFDLQQNDWNHSIENRNLSETSNPIEVWTLDAYKTELSCLPVFVNFVT